MAMAFEVMRSCFSLYGAILLGRARLDMKALAYELREAGLTVQLQLTLVAVIVGVVIGIVSEELLSQVNIPEMMLGTVSSAVIKEFAPLLVGMFVAGRSGIALTVRIGTMVLNREMDGLIVCGVNPIQFTVGPLLLAVALMSFAMVVWTSFITLLTIGLWLRLEVGLPWQILIGSLERVMTPGALLLSAFKPIFFSLLIVMTAAVSGFSVSRQSESISRAAGRTMISAIALVQITNLFFVLLFGA